MRLLVIDGNSIMNRAFYGIKLLSNKHGHFTNAIYGFMNIYSKAIEELKPNAVVAAFDVSAPTFRHKAVETYKANRTGMPPELKQQMPRIKALLMCLGVKVAELEGYEADDILGTLSRMCSENNTECIISTGDRDNLQLINDNVFVRLATNKDTILYDYTNFVSEYSFPPINLIDLKALMGDSSDNISGVTGVGSKTASALITKFLTVENVYDNINDASITKSVRAKLEAGRDSAFQSKWLATIDKNVPLDFALDDCMLGEIDAENATLLLQELEMYSLLERLKLFAKPSNSLSHPAKTLQPIHEYKQEEFTTATLNVLENITENIDFLFGQKLTVICNETIFFTQNLEFIRSFFSNPCRKRTFSAKNAYKFCYTNSIELNNLVFDADIAAYLLNSTLAEYTIQLLCQDYSVEYSNLKENAEAYSLSPLCDKLESAISNADMIPLLLEIEQPLTRVLAEMEVDGVRIDVDGVRTFGERLTADLAQIQTQIFFYSEEPFNISSPKQLAEILFEKLALPSSKKTKTGYSTGADVLEELRDKHPIVDLILQFRQLSKLNSTYVEGLLKVVGDDCRIHSNFKQTETRTGRISSTEPNVQNIPVRTDLGRNMRRFFMAEDGFFLLDADYGQIELRILAALCNDKTMQEAFIQGVDIHTVTASQVFDMPPQMVTSSMRRAAKAVNFGIIYGIGAYSLSKDIGVSMVEARKYIQEYLDHYPNVAKYMDEIVKNAVKDGYVTTMFGRRRYIPELMATNKITQAFGKRAAMNAPIQGSAADIIKIAMVKVAQKLRAEKLNARLILQVHDELIVEVAEKDISRATEILGEEMKNAVRFVVPLVADVNVGRTWYDAKG